MSVFFGIPVDLAYHLVCWLAAIRAPLLGGLATAAAIIAFTVLVRLVLLPLSYFAVRGVRGEAARARLQPRSRSCSGATPGTRTASSEELAALYRAEGTGMFAGCLPLLLQLPFFSVMYRLFLDHSVGGAPNTLLTHRLLAAPLGSQWLAGAGPLSAQGAVFAGLFALLAGRGAAGGPGRPAGRSGGPRPAAAARTGPGTGSTPRRRRGGPGGRPDSAG